MTTSNLGGYTMNVLFVVLIVLGIILVFGFLTYEVVALIRDIRKWLRKKKEKQVAEDTSDKK